MKYNLFVEWSCLFGAAWLVADEILMNHQSLDVFWLYIKQHAAEGQNNRENNWEIRNQVYEEEEMILLKGWMQLELQKNLLLSKVIPWILNTPFVGKQHQTFMYSLDVWMFVPIRSSQKLPFIDHTTDTHSFKNLLLLCWLHHNTRNHKF